MDRGVSLPAGPQGGARRGGATLSAKVLLPSDGPPFPTAPLRVPQTPARVPIPRRGGALPLALPAPPLPAPAQPPGAALVPEGRSRAPPGPPPQRTAPRAGRAAWAGLPGGRGEGRAGSRPAPQRGARRRRRRRRRGRGHGGLLLGAGGLPLRVRHAAHRAHPQPQSGAHEPHRAAAHPGLRHRVSAAGDATPRGRGPGVTRRAPPGEGPGAATGGRDTPLRTRSRGGGGGGGLRAKGCFDGVF